MCTVRPAPEQEEAQEPTAAFSEAAAVADFMQKDENLSLVEETHDCGSRQKEKGNRNIRRMWQKSEHTHTYMLGMYTLYHMSMCTRVYTHILQAHICASTYVLALTDTLPYADTFTHEHPVFVFSSLPKCLAETN